MYSNLKCELKKKGKTQKDVAKLLNISPQAIYMKLNGIHDFTVPEMILIQKEYFPEVPLEELCAKR